jgi:predicted aspartyl protease
MDMLAIKIRWDRQVSRVITPAMVRQAEDFCLEQGYPIKPPVEVRALWDTGSEGTCISAKLAQSLGLEPTADSLEVSGLYGSASSKIYMLDIVLPDKMIVANVLAPEININKDFDIIIGMNIINLGIFTIANENGNTTLYFRVPGV